MAVNVGTAVGYLELDTTKFSSGFQSAMTDLQKFSSESTSTADKFTAMGSALTSVGSTLTKTVTAPIVGVGAAAIKLTSDFQYAMAEVQAISGATGADFTKLENIAKEMGATTRFSATEAAEGLKYMAMAGWDTGVMVEALPGVLLLAAAGNTSLATTSDIVTDAMTAFGLEASEAAHFSDVLAAASNSSNTNIELLGESFKYVAPLAGAAGFSIEDTAVALGLMANQGIKGSQAGTQLRRILSNLVDPTDKQAEALAELNISLTDSEGNMKSLDEIMYDLRAGFDGLTEEEQLFYAATIGGTNGMTGLLAVVNTAPDEFENLRESMRNADGTAQEMADIMGDTLVGQMFILKSTLEAIAISFGELLMPVIRDVVERIQDLLTWINNLDEGQKRTVIQIAAVAAAAGPLLIVIGKLSTAIGSIMKLVTTVGPALSGIAGAAAPVVGVLAAIVAAIVALKAAWDNNFGGFRENIESGLNYMKQNIGPAFENLKDGIVNILRIIKEAWDADIGGLRTIFETVFGVIGQVIGNFLTYFTDMVNIVGLLLQGDFAGAFDAAEEAAERMREGVIRILEIIGQGIMTLIQGAIQSMVDRWESAKDEVLDFVQGMWEGIVEWFTTLPERIGEALSNALEAIITWGRETYENMTESVSDTITNIQEWFNDLPYKIGFALGYAIETIRIWLSDTATAVAEAIPKIIESIVTWFSELPGKVKVWFDNFVETTKEWLTTTAERVREGITTMIANIVTWFSELPGKIKVWYDSVITNTQEWVKNMIAKAIELGTQFVTNIIDWFKKLPGEIKSWIDQVINFIKTLPSQFKQLATDMMNGFFDGVKNVGESIVGWFSGLVETISGFLRGIWDGINSARDAISSSRSMRNSHASGLDYVPYDGYQATLHEGEAVLTRQEREAWVSDQSNTGGGSRSNGDTFVFNSPVRLDPVEASRQMKQAKLEMSLNFR